MESPAACIICHGDTSQRSSCICRAPVHTGCLNRWLFSRAGHGHCMNCRRPLKWVSPALKDEHLDNPVGYINIWHAGGQIHCDFPGAVMTDAMTDAPDVPDLATHIVYITDSILGQRYVDTIRCPAGYMVTLDDVPLFLALTENSRLMYQTASVTS